MTSILTVTLNPALDIFVPVNQFGNGTDIKVVAGGKGVNVSRALNKFVLLQKLFKRLQVCATGLTGGISGDNLKCLLDFEKIKHDFFCINGSTRENLTFFDSSGSSTRIIEPGPFINQEEWCSFLKHYSCLVKNFSWSIISGRIANGLDNKVCTKLINIAHQNKCLCFLDTSGLPLIEGLKARPEFIKPNHEEAQEVLGYSISSYPRIKKAVLEFSRMGAGNVFISRGLDGVIAFNGADIFEITAQIKLKPINDVGCGDSFVGGFIGAYSTGISFLESLRLGVAFGMANMKERVPGGVDIEFVKRIVKKVKIRKLI
ncbi:MAG: 1-phosphofructokinase family hexose kinase [Candidatus Omnitrophica bacterium]|nr:1-phosphofructokinase family hexose kinase [Candidatus Omnitrophota bacterium]